MPKECKILFQCRKIPLDKKQKGLERSDNILLGRNEEN